MSDGRQKKIPSDRQKKKKKTRRTKHKNKSHNKNLTLAYVNARGIKSKIASLKTVLKDNNVDIMVMVETNLKPMEKVKVEGYRWVGRNRTAKTGGGLGFLIHNSISSNFTVEPFTDSPIEDLWIVTTLADNTRLCIGAYYGKQETCSTPQIHNEFAQLDLKTTEMLIKHDHLMLVGDFNAKIGDDQNGITGNLPTISRNGHLLRSFIDDRGLNLMNSKDICKGLWTRVNTKNPSQKSVLDYVLTSRDISPSILSMVIDEDKIHQLQGKNPTDHNTILLTINSNLQKVCQVPKPHWKLNNANWEHFVSDLDVPLSQFMEADFDNTTSECEQWLQVILQSGTKVVGKTTGLPPTKDPVFTSLAVQTALDDRKKAKRNYEHMIQIGADEEIQAAWSIYMSSRQNLISVISKQQAIIAEEKLEKIVKEGNSSKTVWNLRRQQKKSNLEDMWALKNADGTVLYNPDEVKAETARYYSGLYSPRNNELYDQQWIQQIESHIQHLEKATHFPDHNMNMPLTFEEVTAAMANLPLNKSCGPDDIPNEFLKYGGHRVQESVFRLFTSIFNSETPPTHWNTSTLVNLDKGKGDPQLLSNKRGISLTSNLGKLFERVINNRVKKYLKFTQAQAGGREGKSCVDHTFVLKSILNQHQQENVETYCAFIDLEKAYDKVWPSAIYNAMWERGIRGKLWRVIKSLNTGLSTCVQTKYGPTEPVPIMQSIRQGGVLSVCEFSVLIDCLEDDLQKEDLGVHFGDILIASLLLMDDIVLINRSSEGLQKMLNKVNQFLLRWQLVVNPVKTKVVIFNKNKNLPHIEQWSIGDIVIKEISEYKYLGEILSQDLSPDKHIISKKQQAQSMLNLSMAVSGQAPLDFMRMSVLLKFHQRCIVPALLYGCQSWTHTKMELMEDIQYSCIRQYLKVPKTTPKLALLAETGCYHMTTLVEKHQLIYLWTLLNSENTLPHQVYNTQLTHFHRNNTNWASHIEMVLQKYGISHTFNEIRLTSKSGWKNIIKGKISEHENEQYRNQAEAFSKLKNLRRFKRKVVPESYLSLPRDEASVIFRLRTRMLPLKNNMKGIHSDTLCPRCSLETDDEYHLLEVCAKLHHLRSKYSISTFEEIFQDGTSLAKLKDYANFVKEGLQLT